MVLKTLETFKNPLKLSNPTHNVMITNIFKGVARDQLQFNLMNSCFYQAGNEQIRV